MNNSYSSYFKEHVVTLILPYFGNLPNYFDLWLKSANSCEDVNFIICGDKLPYEGQKQNILFLNKSFEWIKERINSVLGFKCTLNTPYKLCDYKPIYGLVFSEYLAESEYWGYCDCDLIFGKMLEDVLYDVTSRSFDKIYKYGHLTLFKNTSEINNVIFGQSEVEKVTYKDVYSMNYVAHFDEGYIIRDLFKNYRVYDGTDFSDISYWNYSFSSSGYGNVNQIFEYNDGKILIHYIDENNNYNCCERIYIHLQKRKMKKDPDIGNRFLIVPNSFVSIDNDYQINEDTIRKYSIDKKSYVMKIKIKRIKSIVSHCLSGALKYRFINKFRKVSL